ncbi:MULTISPECIES: Pvc16 family protein [unclassified Streptomyces]|uniref:Pvc16 family protein n=1 Tax=unclassified Streptomyces TaxID=2593676 RepID=UPI004042A4E4
MDATLKAVLGDAGAPAEIRAADVSFDTPDRDFHPAQTTVNLFLHDVQENRALRDNAPRMDRSGGTYTSLRPPLRVDCTYLVTAWSAQTGGLKSAEEHKLLGMALQWLSREVIEDRFLQGSLRTPPQPAPPPASVAHTREGQSMGQFWTALGVAPRPGFSLAVTVGLQPLEPAVSFPAVQQVDVEPMLSQHPQLCGRVLDHTFAPVPAAEVTVADTGAATTADPSGAFAFTGLDFGTHTLLVHVQGRPEVSRQVTYEATAQVHDVILPGP